MRSLFARRFIQISLCALLLFVLGGAPALLHAQDGPTGETQPAADTTSVIPIEESTSDGFVPLTEIPGFTDKTSERTLADYLNVLFRIAIGLGALIAVIKITFAGIKYMSQDSFFSKEEAKNDIKGALLGLLIMLSVVLVFTVINPDILNLNTLNALNPVKITPGPPPRTGPDVTTYGSPDVAVSTPDATTVDAFAATLPPNQRVIYASEATYARGSAATKASIAERTEFVKACGRERTRWEDVTETSPGGIPHNIGIRLYCIGAALPAGTSPTDTSVGPVNVGSQLRYYPEGGDYIPPFSRYKTACEQNTDAVGRQQLVWEEGERVVIYTCNLPS